MTTRLLNVGALFVVCLATLGCPGCGFEDGSDDGEEDTESVASELLPSVYEIAVQSSATSSIEASGKCSSSPGQGGNLLEAGQRYLGKCEGAGLPPQVVGTKGNRYLRFRTDPSVRAAKDRTELMVNQEYFPFGERVYVAFELMIPSGTADTNDYFYLMQLWQCSPAPPIGGVRVTRGKGNGHTINFLTRGDFSERSFGSTALTPGSWHTFIISYFVWPRGGDGEVKVWVDRSPDPIVINASFGYFNRDTCVEGERPPQHFRVKFGMYKGNEPGARFESRLRNMRIGPSYQSVRPW